ncbi:MAG: hypothetical protein ABR906_08350 [Terracidiphilus sp.]|jgi:hypothetical protein
MTIPDIFDLLKRIKWDSIHSWMPFHTLLPLVGGALTAFLRRQVKRRNARLAQHWPVADGKVLDINVAIGSKFFGSPRQFNATFKYSYTVQDAGVVSYFSGDFSRLFPNKEQAWEWLELLKHQRIRVHVCPGKPEVSAVLESDLDAHFYLPARSPADLVLFSTGSHPE